MRFETLRTVLSQVREMARETQTYHASGQLWPQAHDWSRAPELHKDNRSDIYSLGAALSQLLQHRRPEIPPEADRVMQNILQRTLSYRPQGRYSCCEELLEDLDRVLTLLKTTPDSN